VTPSRTSPSQASREPAAPTAAAAPTIPSADGGGAGSTRCEAGRSLVVGAPYAAEVATLVRSCASAPPLWAIACCVADAIAVCAFVAWPPPAVGTDSTYWSIAGGPPARAMGAARSSATPAVRPRRRVRRIRLR
jgi:hypothetical protein